MLREGGRVLVLALMFFLTALAVGVPLGYFWEEMERGLGATLTSLVSSALSWIASASVAFFYARRWPDAAVRRTLFAFFFCTMTMLALVLLVATLLQVEAFEDSPLVLVMDLALGLLLALAAAATGARRPIAR